MLEGECPNCGRHYFGWALRFPRNQTCPNCGAGLEIKEDGKTVLKGYSPFTAKDHVVEPSTKSQPPRIKSTDSPPQNKRDRS